MAEVRVDVPDEGATDVDNLNVDESTTTNTDVTPAAPEGNPEGTPAEGDSTEGTEGDLGVQLNDNKQVEEDTSKVINSNPLLTDKGINFDTLTNEYNDKGALSEETYKTLEEAGFPKTVVNAYIAGQEALANQFTSTVKGYVGGEEGFNKVAQFIKAEGQESVNAYNALVDSGNLSAIKGYLEGVQAKMTLKNGTANPTVLGGGSVQVGGFETADDMMSAMNDKRYGTDDKFTQQVQTKMAKSQFIKFNR